MGGKLLSVTWIDLKQGLSHTVSRAGGAAPTALARALGHILTRALLPPGWQWSRAVRARALGTGGQRQIQLQPLALRTWFMLGRHTLHLPYTHTRRHTHTHTKGAGTVRLGISSLPAWASPPGPALQGSLAVQLRHTHPAALCGLRRARALRFCWLFSALPTSSSSSQSELTTCFLPGACPALQAFSSNLAASPASP